MILRAHWREHEPDWDSRCRAKQAAILAHAACVCGVAGRHTHCPGCGLLLSRGDWSGKGILTAALNGGTP